MRRDAQRDACATRARMAMDDAKQALFAGGPEKFKRCKHGQLMLESCKPCGRRVPSDPARQLALELLDWDSQFGGPPDAECLVAGEDWARWTALARKVVGR